MNPVKFAGAASGTSVGADDGAVLAAHRLDHIVGPVDENEIILPLVERREGETPRRAGSLCLRLEDELADEIAVLAEYLHAIVGAVADVNKPVLPQRNAMHRVGELRCIRVVGWKLVVGRRLAVSAPNAFNRASVAIEHGHAMGAIAVGGINLVGSLVVFE